ncbi:Dihydroxyacetone kinase 1 [Hypsizygus marmoreus]|uniref:Dihydroxyacetone kinase 1 n=1 Tax=Hypsizygus marmoreus TaxID=39966 RepID=A0A369K6X1_HYPMA|nr:Dihydroxyacetone kinase 1 [Hypsizygus marmoreus]
MSTKHIFNSADGLVLKALRGAVALNPALRLHAPSKIVYLAPGSHSPRDAVPIVAVISGGGAGHEPAHAGYTGRGMLAASVSGDIFASPSAKQILQTIQLASYGTNAVQDGVHHAHRDVLVIINNYTGDRLNFGLAIEKTLASSPHVRIESVVVADDVSLLHAASSGSNPSQSRKTLVGARGLAGNILVCKILGAFAERGENLARVKALGDAVVHNLASIGIGLEHCHVPGRDSAVSHATRMAEDECEIGLGLHNEPGVMRKRMKGPEKVVEEMLRLIMSSRDGTGHEGFIQLAAQEEDKSNGTDDVVLFTNNLGGMSQLEMGAILDEVLSQLGTTGLYPVRIYLSAYMTSLNAPGFSISLLNLSGVSRTLESRSDWNSTTPVSIPGLLDDPTEALAWVGVRCHWPMKGQVRKPHEEEPSSSRSNTVAGVEEESLISRGDVPDASWVAMKRAIRAACEAVIRVEKDLTYFDTVLGDGDCGMTFSAGARAILTFLDDTNVESITWNVADLVRRFGDILEDSMGGTSGALFAIFFTAFSSALRDLNDPPASTKDWGVAVRKGLDALSKHTPAKPGDRTLVDALAPFCAALTDGKTLEQAVDAARVGADSTKTMHPVLGRAAYVTLTENVGELPPDPGAWGVVAIVDGLRRGMMSEDVSF